MEANKQERLHALRESFIEQVNMAASEVGGLTEEEIDEWGDALADAVYTGLEGVEV